MILCEKRVRKEFKGHSATFEQLSISNVSVAAINGPGFDAIVPDGRLVRENVVLISGKRKEREVRIVNHTFQRK